MTQDLARPRGLERALTVVVIFTVLFPFIPGIVPNTDTQPTFLVFVVLLGVARATFGKSQRSRGRGQGSGVFLAAALVCLATALLLLSLITSGAPPIVSRVVAFLQFSVAVGWAYRNGEVLDAVDMRKVFFVYAVFTVVFLASHGAVEKLLIHSRTSGYAALAATGRGASTLSPEPSFFALQILNLYVIYLLANRGPTPRRRDWLLFAAAAMCCLTSFSAYGVVVFLLLLVLNAAFLLPIGIAIVAVIAAIPSLGQALSNLKEVRAASLILKIVAASSLSPILADTSLSVRTASFGGYLRSLAGNFGFGDGFSYFGGGGLVGIVAAFGVVGVVAAAAIALEFLAIRGVSLGERVVLFGWLGVMSLSGPIGVAPIGVVIGLVLARNHGGGAVLRPERELIVVRR